MILDYRQYMTCHKKNSGLWVMIVSAKLFDSMLKTYVYNIIQLWYGYLTKIARECAEYVNMALGIAYYTNNKQHMA